MKDSHTVRTSSLLEFLLFLEPEAPSKDIWFSFGFESMFLVSFPLWFPLAYTLFEYVTNKSWFLEVWITPIWTNLSCSYIKDSGKASREGIFQLGMEALLKWIVETKIDYYEPRFLNTENTSCSSFLSNSHCLHCSTSDLYFVKKCWIDLKLLGCKEMSSFSNIFPWSSYCFPKQR